MSKVSPYFGPELPSTHQLLGLSLGYLPVLGSAAAPSIFARYPGLTLRRHLLANSHKYIYTYTILKQFPLTRVQGWLVLAMQVSVLWLFIVKVKYTTCGNNAEKPLDQTEARRAEKNFFETTPPPFSQGLDNHPPLK